MFSKQLHGFVSEIEKACDSGEVVPEEALRLSKTMDALLDEAAKLEAVGL